MSGDQLASGLIWFVVFLFSSTCHEAAHAWAAKRGGDETAYAAGQVSLNPFPHIQREIFGMLIMPWLSYLTAGWMMGWASAPYDPYWARRHPRRAAWMALAGPAANFALVLVAALLIHIGVQAGAFELTGRLGFESLVRGPSGVASGAAAFLSILFALNLLLGTFNLIPIPPLDGFGVLGILLPEGATLKLMNFRDSMGGMTILGLLVAWRVAGPVLDWILYSGASTLLYLSLPR
jgi:Zn-dependent protease